MVVSSDQQRAVFRPITLLPKRTLEDENVPSNTASVLLSVNPDNSLPSEGQSSGDISEKSLL